jgi:hypothetical protein
MVPLMMRPLSTLRTDTTSPVPPDCIATALPVMVKAPL